MTTPSQIRRPAFFVSDRTGITSENVGDALLEQFDGIKFKRATYPFIDTQEKPPAWCTSSTNRQKNPASAR